MQLQAMDAQHKRLTGRPVTAADYAKMGVSSRDCRGESRAESGTSSVTIERDNTVLQFLCNYWGRIMAYDIGAGCSSVVVNVVGIDLIPRQVY